MYRTVSAECSIDILTTLLRCRWANADCQLSAASQWIVVTRQECNELWRVTFVMFLPFIHQQCLRSTYEFSNDFVLRDSKSDAWISPLMGIAIYGRELKCCTYTSRTACKQWSSSSRVVRNVKMWWKKWLWRLSSHDSLIINGKQKADFLRKQSGCWMMANINIHSQCTLLF
jgi:hypothetical protein